MPQRYYPTSNLYPYAVEAVLTRIKLYFCSMLYPTEDYVTQSSKRFILSDTSDDANAIRRSIDTFKNSQGQFPFTAYSINDDSPLDYKSHYQVSGNFYSTLINAYISFIPMNLELFMTTYFTTPFDFWRAMSIFALDEATLSRLDIPLIINDVPCYFTIDLAYTTERGQLAFDIEQQFQVGKIYPVIHSVTIKGAYIVLANNSNQDRFEQSIVYPVDDIILYIRTLEDAHNLEQNILLATAYSPDIPEVVTSYPIMNASGVPRSSDITLSFNVGMNEDSVYNNIDIVPYMDKDMSFDFSGRVLTIAPRDLLTASTEYSILINDEAKSSSSIYLASDYELIFTTGLS
jgi:hypothetical protein